MIERRITKDILKRLKQFPAVGIIGPRQSGKTTLVKRILSQLPKKSIYLDLESPSDLNRLRESELFLRKHLDACVVLDEIQEMPQLFPLLRSLIDLNRKPGRYILLGSASPFLLKKSSESLAGRISYVELNPLHYSEITDRYSFERHWFRGGFPNSLLEKKDEAAFLWIESFIRTYLERDLPGLGSPASPLIMKRFLSMLAHAQGSVWNAGMFAKSLGVTEPTVRKYIDFLEYTFLITRLQPFFVNVRKRIVKAPKVFIRDSGMLHSLAGIRSVDGLYDKLLIGQSFEGYAIEQIRQVAPSTLSLYYYRTHQGSECDLVLVRGFEPVAAVEIKYSAAPSLSRGNTVALEDLNTKQNFIITPESDDYPLKEKIRVCSLPTFLSKYLPKLA